MKKRMYFYGGLFIILVIALGFIKNPVFIISRESHGLSLKANRDLLLQHVTVLSQMVPPRSFEHPDSLQKAAQYIFENFAKLGLKAKIQTFQVHGHSYSNVIVHLGPVDGEPTVIGAHYDVCDDLPGADDNASGTAGLLELARLLEPVQHQLKRPIELVAYSLEEPPTFGSENMGSFIHANSLKTSEKKIKLMISLEMIGYFRDDAKSQQYPMPIFSFLYPSSGHFISMIARPQEWLVLREAKILFMRATHLPVESANIPRVVPGVDLSDQLSYWDLGMPAMMITDTASMRNHNYHRAEDVANTLDYQRMAEVVNGVAAIAVGL